MIDIKNILLNNSHVVLQELSHGAYSKMHHHIAIKWKIRMDKDEIGMQINIQLILW